MSTPQEKRSPRRGDGPHSAPAEWEGGTESPPTWSDLTPDPQGLVTGVVQDRDGAVRMVAWLSEASYEQTLETGLVTFWSRSRERLWTKGEESGNTLSLLDVKADCDGDTLLLTVDPAGPTCHTGTETCFGEPDSPAGQFPEGTATHPPEAGGRTQPATGRREGGTESFAPTRFTFLDTLWATIESRAEERPEGSYTTQLIDGGPDLAARKVVEEATEVLVAAKNHAAGIDDDQRLAEEAADLVYHLLVTLAERGVDPQQVDDELRARHG